MADITELKIGHLSKDQADLLPSLAIDDGQVIYHEKNGMQFADYLGKRHGYGSVISGVFNGSEYVDFADTDFNTILEVIKSTESVHHGQIINVNNSIFMYKKVNDNNFIVKLNDTESSVNANTAGYIIHIPNYKDTDNVTIDAVISIYDATHGEKVFFIRIVNGTLDLSACQDLDGQFVPGDLGISVRTNGGLTAIVSTLNSNLKVISYSVDSTGSAINNGFYIAAGDMELIYEWMSKSTLPYDAYASKAVVLNGEIHLIGGAQAHAGKHYKWNGTSWESVSTVINNNAQVSHSVVVYNNEIHMLGGINSTAHYKWNGTSWQSVSTLPYPFTYGCAVAYDNEIHILGGSDRLENHWRWNGTRWISASTLPFVSYLSSAVVYNNELHLLGSGASKSGMTVQSHTAHYKWNGIAWEQVSVLPYKSLYSDIIVHNGMLHMIGGENNPKAHYVFNGSEWVENEELPFEYVYGEAVSLNGELHIMSSFYNNDTTHSKKHYVLTPQE